MACPKRFIKASNSWACMTGADFHVSTWNHWEPLRTTENTEHDRSPPMKASSTYASLAASQSYLLHEERLHIEWDFKGHLKKSSRNHAVAWLPTLLLHIEKSLRGKSTHRTAPPRLGVQSVRKSKCHPNTWQQWRSLPYPILSYTTPPYTTPMTYTHLTHTFRLDGLT